MDLRHLIVWALLLCCPLVWAQSIPFNVAAKAMPQGTNWDKLVPEKVGPYQRVRLQPPSAGNDGQAQYQGRGQKPFMLFGRADNDADLAATFVTIEGESRAAPNEPSTIDRVSLRGDPRYVYRAGKRGAFFAWSRGLYYFSVEYAGGDAGMQEFMAAFPY